MLTRKNVRILVGLFLLGGAWPGYRAYQAYKQTSAENAAYFYRLNVKVSHQDEMFDMNIVVTCDTKLVRQFGSGAIMSGPQFYAERTKANHAIGVRPTLGCAGQTTENGGAPADLLPSIYWFPDADDMTFAIMYATEDAYENPLSQLKFHGATMHKATVAEFRVFQAAAKTKSIVPTDVDQIPVRDPALGPFTVAEVEANGGKAPKPNWAVPHHHICETVRRTELSDAAREIVRQAWPAHRPKYWTIGGEAFNQMMEAAARNNPEKQYRGLRKDGLADRRLSWTIAVPDTDGLPTRVGGGVLLALDRDGKLPKTNPKGMLDLPAEIYPVQNSTTFGFYNITDKSTDYIWSKIDLRGGQTRGFAYCESGIRENLDEMKPGSDPWSGLKYFLPGITTRKVRLYVGDDEVDTSAVASGARYRALGSHFSYIFERDEAYYHSKGYF
jgi:hypothetical protein